MKLNKYISVAYLRKIISYLMSSLILGFYSYIFLYYFSNRWRKGI